MNLKFLRYAFFNVTCIIGFVFGIVFYSSVLESTADCRNQTVDITNAPKLLGQIDPNRKYAVFSTTSGGNVESLGFIFMLPLTALAWKRIGFDSIVIVVGSEDVWNSDPLSYTVLTTVRQLDALVIFLDVHPTNSVMISQVRN